MSHDAVHADWRGTIIANTCTVKLYAVSTVHRATLYAVRDSIFDVIDDATTRSQIEGRPDGRMSGAPWRVRKNLCLHFTMGFFTVRTGRARAIPAADRCTTRGRAGSVMCYLCDSIGEKCPDLSYASFEDYTAGWSTSLRDDLLPAIRAKWAEWDSKPGFGHVHPEAPETQTTSPPERPPRLVIVRTGENAPRPLKLTVCHLLPFTDLTCAPSYRALRG